METFFRSSLLALCALGACSEVDGSSAPPDDAGDSEMARDESSDGGSEASEEESPAAVGAEQPPATWQRVTGECGMSLRAPSLVATQLRGVDSCVAGWEGPDCSYLGDVGGYSDRLDRYAQDERYSVETVAVVGKSARLVTSQTRLEDQRYFVGIHIPAPLWSDAAGVSATVVAHCFSAEGRDTARRVLQTVELPESSQRAAQLAPEIPGLRVRVAPASRSLLRRNRRLVRP